LASHVASYRHLGQLESTFPVWHERRASNHPSLAPGRQNLSARVDDRRSRAVEQ
jgi:hypothetical protein